MSIMKDGLMMSMIAALTNTRADNAGFCNSVYDAETAGVFVGCENAGDYALALLRHRIAYLENCFKGD